MHIILCAENMSKLHVLLFFFLQQVNAGDLHSVNEPVAA
jgi:hypothetical protein